MLSFLQEVLTQQTFYSSVKCSKLSQNIKDLYQCNIWKSNPIRAIYYTRSGNSWIRNKISKYERFLYSFNEPNKQLLPTGKILWIRYFKLKILNQPNMFRISFVCAFVFWSKNLQNLKNQTTFSHYLVIMSKSHSK